MNAPSVHGGGAMLARISDNDGALLIGDVVRGMAMLEGRDESMVSVSQSSRTDDTDDEGDSSLGDGFKQTVQSFGDLDLPIITSRTRNGVVGIAIQQVANRVSAVT